jgi:hypothetical protein
VSAYVPELKGSEVKTVAEWENQIFPDDVALNRTKMVASRAVLWRGGLYVPAGEFMKDTVPADVVAKTLDTFHDETWCYKGIYDYEAADPETVRISDCIRGGDVWEVYGITKFNESSRQDPKFEPTDTIVQADSETDRAIVQKIVESLVFIDGTVWKKVPSIHLELNLNRGAGKAWVTVAHGPFGYGRGYVRRGISRKLWHRSYALNEMGRLLASVGSDIDVCWQIGKLAIHDIDAIRFDGASDYAARAMKNAVVAHSRSLGATDSGLINDWVAVREAERRYDANPSVGISADDIERLVRLIDAHPNPGYFSLYDEVKDHLESYRAPAWDRNAAMPRLGHHNSNQWQSS